MRKELDKSFLFSITLVFVFSVNESRSILESQKGENEAYPILSQMTNAFSINIQVAFETSVTLFVLLLLRTDKYFLCVCSELYASRFARRDLVSMPFAGRVGPIMPVSRSTAKTKSVIS